MEVFKNILDKESVNFVCNGQAGKYFRLCESYTASVIESLFLQSLLIF